MKQVSELLDSLLPSAAPHRGSLGRCLRAGGAERPGRSLQGSGQPRHAAPARDRAGPPHPAPWRWLIAVRCRVRSTAQTKGCGREKAAEGKAVLGTESRECFRVGFVLGGEQPGTAEQAVLGYLTSRCCTGGERRPSRKGPGRCSTGDFIWFPLGGLCGCFWKEMSSAPTVRAAGCVQGGRDAGKANPTRGLCARAG